MKNFIILFNGSVYFKGYVKIGGFKFYGFFFIKIKCYIKILLFLIW